MGLVCENDYILSKYSIKFLNIPSFKNYKSAYLHICISDSLNFLSFPLYFLDSHKLVFLKSLL